MGKFKDLTGQRFGMLEVLERVPNQDGLVCWLCRCDCGNEKIIKRRELCSGDAISCGCFKRNHFITHNMSYTRIYKIWGGIKSRCYSKNSLYYKFYGARGIKVCDEWLDKKKGFINFYNWAIKNGYDENAKRGECTIDRINVNGDYEPSNCRWVTNKEQQINKRSNHFLTYNGETLTISQWAEKLKINDSSLTHFVNDKKGNIESFLEKEKKRKRKVVLIEKDTMKKFKEFSTAIEAMNFLKLNKNQRPCAYRCLNNQQTYSYGYIWRYVDEADYTS